METFAALHTTFSALLSQFNSLFQGYSTIAALIQPAIMGLSLVLTSSVV